MPPAGYFDSFWFLRRVELDLDQVVVEFRHLLHRPQGPECVVKQLRPVELAQVGVNVLDEDHDFGGYLKDGALGMERF